MHALCAEHIIQREEESQWGTGLINALISIVLLRHGCFPGHIRTLEASED